MLKVLKCDVCGAILEVVNPGHVVTCCGQEMKELTPNTTDAATEKHVPVVEVSGNTVTVKVGSVDHPMTEEHLITTIWLETDKGVHRADLNHEMAPAATFALADGEKAVAAYEYCNLHGLWKADI